MHLDQIKIPPPPLPSCHSLERIILQKGVLYQSLNCIEGERNQVDFLLSKLNFSCIKGTDGVGGGGLTHSEPLPSQLHYQMISHGCICRSPPQFLQNQGTGISKFFLVRKMLLRTSYTSVKSLQPLPVGNPLKSKGHHIS